MWAEWEAQVVAAQQAAVAAELAAAPVAEPSMAEIWAAAGGVPAPPAAAAPAAAAASPAKTEYFGDEVLSEEEEEWQKEWRQYNYRLRVCDDRQLFWLFKSAADELKWRKYAPVDVLCVDDPALAARVL